MGLSNEVGFLFELVMPVMDKENEQCVKCEVKEKIGL